MISASIISILASAILIVLLINQRKVVFSYSLIGVFVITHIVFVLVGVLLLPLIERTAQEWFGSFDLYMLDEGDKSLAIILAAGGTMLVFCSYRIVSMAMTRGLVFRRPVNLLVTPVRPEFGLSYRTLLLGSLLSLALAAVFVARDFGTFMYGLRHGILAGDYASTLDARRETTDTYLYVLLVYNVLPFFSVGLLLAAKARRSRGGLWFSYAYSAFSALLLLLVFQKRPLLVFIISLILARIWYKGLDPRDMQRITGRLRMKRLFSLMGYSLVPFSLLIMLYYSNLGSSGQGVADTLSTLLEASLTRIFGRLSLGVPMYVHYFPDVTPFYGFSNIGKFAFVNAQEVYADTREVYSYFTGGTGNVAVPAIIDFYGSFGMRGWLMGCLGLGTLLAVGDRALSLMKDSSGKCLLVIFAFETTYYLSQASVARTLAGYGGLLFFVLWLALRYSRPRASVSNVLTQNDKTVYSHAQPAA